MTVFTSHVVSTKDNYTSSRQCTNWLFAHDLFSGHKNHHYDSNCCLNNMLPSFHTDNINTVAFSPTTYADFAPTSYNQFHQHLQVSRLEIAQVPSTSAGLLLLKFHKFQKDSLQ